MFFDIHTSNGVPVYEQVARQITFAIASGGLEIGQMIPSVREMARQLAINPNTVARAYRQLQDDTILESIRGSGVAVTRGAKAKCQSVRHKLVSLRIANVLQEARQSQLTDDEIRQIISKELDKPNTRTKTKRGDK